MKHVFTLTTAAAVAILLCATPRSAQAAPIMFEFCPQNADCGPLGLTSALLTFEEIALGTDVNDYHVTASFTGTASSPTYLDLFSFALNGVQTPQGYESLPTNLTGPAAYSFVFDNINNSDACESNTNQAQEVCAQIAGFGATPLANNTLTFEFDVDLAGTFMLSQTSGVNLRGLFRDENGGFFGPILSPSGNYTVPDCEDCPPPPPPPPPPVVPEPASMLLLGSGLAGLAMKFRKQRKSKVE